MTVELDPGFIQSWDTMLMNPSGYSDQPDIIEKFTVDISAHQIDFKLCNGDYGTDPCPPYLDVVLFNDRGVEVGVCEPAFEQIEGEYHLRDDEREVDFIIHIKRKP